MNEDLQRSTAGVPLSNVFRILEPAGPRGSRKRLFRVRGWRFRLPGAPHKRGPRESKARRRTVKITFSRARDIEVDQLDGMWAGRSKFAAKPAAGLHRRTALLLRTSGLGAMVVDERGLI